MDAEQYMNHWIKNKVWTHLKWPKHQRRFKTIAGFLEGETFVDVGCAFGHSTAEIEIFRSGAWTGIDFSKRAIERAKMEFPRIDFIYCEDFSLYDHTSRKFDGVVCSEVIEHVEKDWELIKGLLGITKKTLVVTTPNCKVSDPGHLRVYTEETLTELFKGTDFVIHQIGPFFYLVVRK